MNRRNLLIGASAAVVAAGASYGGWVSSVGSMRDYAAYTARLRAPLVPSDIQDIIRYAALAANSHNTQPWHFHVGARTIEILPDFARRTPVVDPDDHHLFVSLGCAAANLELAAAASGRPGEIQCIPDDRGVQLAFENGLPRQDPLLSAITRRQSTRAAYDGRPVAGTDLDALTRAAAIPGTNLVLVLGRGEIGRIRDLVVAGNDEQMADPAFMRELKQWIRFNPRSAIASGDGLFAAASGNPPVPTLLGSLALDLVLGARSEAARYARQIDSSAGVAIFFGDEEDWEHWVRVGMACQRFALAATQRGLTTAFINQPVEVAHLRSALAGLVGTTKRPDVVLRFGYGPTLPCSPRRPVAAVIV